MRNILNIDTRNTPYTLGYVNEGCASNVIEIHFNISVDILNNPLLEITKQDGTIEIMEGGFYNILPISYFQNSGEILIRLISVNFTSSYIAISVLEDLEDSDNMIVKMQDDNYVVRKIRVSSSSETNHTHSNKSILDKTTASYTIEEKSKLESIERNAQENVIEKIKVNGVEVIPNENKEVDINASTPTIDLSDYALKEHTHEEYITEEELQNKGYASSNSVNIISQEIDNVKNRVTNVEDTLENKADNSYVDEVNEIVNDLNEDISNLYDILENKSDKDHTHSQYASKDDVDKARISAIDYIVDEVLPDREEGFNEQLDLKADKTLIRSNNLDFPYVKNFFNLYKEYGSYYQGIFLQTLDEDYLGSELLQCMYDEIEKIGIWHDGNEENSDLLILVQSNGVKNAENGSFVSGTDWQRNYVYIDTYNSFTFYFSIFVNNDLTCDISIRGPFNDYDTVEEYLDQRVQKSSLRTHVAIDSADFIALFNEYGNNFEIDLEVLRKDYYYDEFIQAMDNEIEKIGCFVDVYGGDSDVALLIESRNEADGTKYRSYIYTRSCDSISFYIHFIYSYNSGKCYIYMVGPFVDYASYDEYLASRNSSNGDGITEEELNAKGYATETYVDNTADTVRQNIERYVDQEIAGLDDVYATIGALENKADVGDVDDIAQALTLKADKNDVPTYKESLDSSNPIILRNLDTGVYKIYGYFRYYSTQSGISAVDPFAFVIVEKGSTYSYISIISSNSCKQYKITDTSYEDLNDSGWLTATLESTFKAYDESSTNTPQYRKIGNTVEIRGIVSPVEELAASNTGVTIFTLPAGYRPNKAVYEICQGSSRNVWLLSVTTSGAVQISRYGTTTNIAIPTTAWLTFNKTFTI